MMDETKKRVEQEKEELDARIEKIKKVIYGKKAKELPVRQYILLVRQENLMLQYSKVLGERLAIWDEVNSND